MDELDTGRGRDGQYSFESQFDALVQPAVLHPGVAVAET